MTGRAIHPDYIGELRWRGLLHQTTSDEIPAYLASAARTGYAGFDPTADSLTIGNLIPMMMLAHFQRAGHRPIALVGGGTGLIGDPSGKSAERQLQTAERIEANVASIKGIFARVMDFDTTGPSRAAVIDNSEWLCKLGFVEVLRDVGKHFSVNMMIQKESVAARLNTREQGISYTEFSYMILQAYDFLHLHRQHGCTVQCGGSDQFGNIVAGIDLIRRDAHGGDAHAYGITAPLVMKADGGKIGKTESGAIWLSAHRTSPFAFHQFWLNASDADVPNFLRWYTFLDRDTIEQLDQATRDRPNERAAQKTLAREVTRTHHGEAEMARAEAAAQALFSGEVRALDGHLLGEVFAEVPRTQHPLTSLDGAGASLLDLLPQTSLATSKREAREFLQAGAVSVNGEKAGLDRALTKTDLLHGGRIVLRRGKKQWHATEWA
ncbi:MAG: tyrosine--tRNA ligase [Phycisphaerae bacterium]|nr:tyrosine--tRNA ligase [Phycisphaerae bacterium]